MSEFDGKSELENILKQERQKEKWHIPKDTQYSTPNTNSRWNRIDQFLDDHKYGVELPVVSAGAGISAAGVLSAIAGVFIPTAVVAYMYVTGETIDMEAMVTHAAQFSEKGAIAGGALGVFASIIAYADMYFEKRVDKKIAYKYS